MAIRRQEKRRGSATAESGLLAAAILLQGFGLAWWAWRDSSRPALVWICAGTLLAAALALARRRQAPGYLEATLATASMGGLGMLIGGLLDARVAAVGAVQAMGGGPGMAEHAGLSWSWATALMLVFCLPVCGRCLPVLHRGRFASRLAALLTTCGAMVAGMLLGGALLGTALAAALRSPALGGHLAMVVGMTAGMAAGALLLAALPHLAPPSVDPT
ncbi:MAG TPA: hypothetical protein VOA87_15420 [Thermoanaerobaculia bacterium]|nr:hypothetical protein [Thermoanaerobaculia bacterium]